MSDATIYDVRWADLNRFQSFLFDLPEPTLETFFQFAGVPLQDSWSPQPIYSHQPRLERPSFWHLFGTAVIVMDQEVIDLVGQFIYPVGELLSLRESGTNEQFYALNILRDIDCLNPHAYRIDELDVRPDFIPHRLDESGLFKVPQLDTTHISAWGHLDYLADPIRCGVIPEHWRSRVSSRSSIVLINPARWSLGDVECPRRDATRCPDAVSISSPIEVLHLERRLSGAGIDRGYGHLGSSRRSCGVRLPDRSPRNRRCGQLRWPTARRTESGSDRARS